MLSLDISEIRDAFPAFRVGIVVAEGMRLTGNRPAALAAWIERTEIDVGKYLAAVTLADIPEVRAWREAYRAFGVKKTSYRSSVERLLKTVGRGDPLPRINPLVDL